VVSPHIDYMRGGMTYARVWRRAAAAARGADLAIVVGTDHFGASGSITLSHVPYATPFGVLPQPPEILSALAEAIGREDAFAGELNHRTEHSVELSAAWLHHMRGGSPIDTVPVLVGSFDEHAESGSNPMQSESLRRFLDALAAVMDGRRALLVASVDLSHMGPAFGGEPLDDRGRDRLVVSDRGLVESLIAGDADGFLRALGHGADGTNVCGTGPLFVTLRALGETTGHEVDYRLCPADEADTSAVSICGMLFD
jgi:AmmeMemoRadiSam system protein B